MKYELFYLVAASKEAELEAIKAGAQEIVTAEGGVFDEKEVVEKRKLAYQVKHETHGFYVARRFELEDPTSIQSITRKLNLYTNILRSVISRASELPELKTKEERIGAASAVSERKAKSVKTPVVAAAKTPDLKTIPGQTETPAAKDGKTEKTTEKKPVHAEKTAEDIDKKLEEILNI
ncbi:MAG: 30S ribosomal protein S6 [Candidatus Moranbacteria bacterium]|nr:30S ribosomal protein S6 [Candidatus Moranbacteria bacterium]